MNSRVKFKKSKINMSRADNPHTFSRLEHNLRFTEKQNNNKQTTKQTTNDKKQKTKQTTNDRGLPV